MVEKLNGLKCKVCKSSRQLHLANYMFRIVKGNCPPTFVDKLEYVSGGCRNGTNCDLYVGKSKSLKESSYFQIQN